MCSIPHEEILPQNVLPRHHSNAVYPLRYVECQTFLIALSSVILCQISAHFIQINTREMSLTDRA